MNNVDASSSSAKAQIGVTGLAVMGSNIARNFARHGYTVALHNRSIAKTDALLENHGGDGDFTRTETVAEFVAWAKGRRGGISYGSPGVGTTLHLTMEQIAKERGIQWTHVPFRGTADSTNALLGGHIDLVSDASGWAPLVNAGKLRLLVIWSDKRSKSWPNVPTLKEAGIAMVSNSPFGIGGPKGMDPKVVKILHDAFKKGSDEPSYQETLAKLDQEPFYLNTADYRAYAEHTFAEQKQLMGALGFKPE